MRALFLLPVVLLYSADEKSVSPRIFFQRGVNFTAEEPDWYSSKSGFAMLDKLPAYGVNAIALVPFGFSPPNQPIVRFGVGAETDESIAQTLVHAHQLGLKVMLKPQIWVGGNGFPGSIDFPSATDRDRWFEQYGLFLDHYAKLAASLGADLLCVGVEFQKLSVCERDWRALIARARKLYRGPLVYAATQGPEFETIRFWDALDYIGLSDYYPLPDDLSVDAVVRKVEAVQRRYNRPVIFPEAGFASLEAPQREPWSEAPRKLSPADQARCYEAVLRAFYKKPWFYGVYWWKVGTNGFGGPSDGSHTPWGKPAMDVVAKWYLHGGR